MAAHIIIDRLDHFVLTVQNIDDTINFYTKVLGMEVITFGTKNERKALKFGNSKINLHERGKEIVPHAAAPTAGSADLCLISTTPIEQVVATLSSHGVSIEQGPVGRTGANGPINSVYVRDPDGNLVEISNYV